MSENNNAARRLPQTKFSLKGINGSYLGKIFELSASSVSLGRSSSNDIILDDPRISRNAMQFEIQNGNLFFKVIADRQVVTVNGNELIEGALKSGDVLQIGDSQLQIDIELPMTAARPSQANDHLKIVNAQGAVGGKERPKKSTLKKKKESPMMNITLAIIGFVFLLLFLKNSDVIKKKAQTIKTAEEIEKETMQIDANTVQVMKRAQFKTEESRLRYEEAQKHFLIGFRDYRMQQFWRAIKSFETARAIDPSHEMASRYQRLAEKERDEMITDLLVEGKRYREKQMYKKCSASFEKVLDAISNPTDIRYRQSQSFKNECDVMQKNNFR